VSPNGLPPAWPVVAASSPGPFRIVWFGRPVGGRFPAPGGDAVTLLEAGESSIRYGLTDRDGITALDTGREEHGPGYAFLDEVMRQIVAGDTRHAGQLLAPLGVRFLVAAEGDVPGPLMARLEDQLDLYRVPAGGLVIYRNPRALPAASVITDPGFADAATTGDQGALARLPETAAVPLDREDGGWVGDVPAGTAYVAEQYDAGWSAQSAGSSVRLEEAFGWAMDAQVGAGTLEIRYERTWVRTAELVALGILWLGALWVTRKPGAQ
jgi:hypothetical protein